MRVVVLDAGSEGREALVSTLDDAGHRPVVVGSLLGLRRLAQRGKIEEMRDAKDLVLDQERLIQSLKQQV